MSRQKQESVSKWGPLVAKKFTIVPSILFERQRELGMDPTDFNIVLQLISYWWKESDLPWPSKRTLAERLGVDTSTIRRHLTKLEKNKLIVREPRFSKHRGQETNRYNLSPLVHHLRLLAEQAASGAEIKREAQ